MSYGTQTLITLTPDQLGEIVRGVVRSELACYVPPVTLGPELPEMPTRRQVRDYLSVTYVTLAAWAKDTPDRKAILVPFKLGNRVRYRREDVLAAFKEKRRFKASKV